MQYREVSDTNLKQSPQQLISKTTTTATAAAAAATNISTALFIIGQFEAIFK